MSEYGLKLSQLHVHLGALLDDLYKYDMKCSIQQTHGPHQPF